MLWRPGKFRAETEFPIRHDVFLSIHCFGVLDGELEHRDLWVERKVHIHRNGAFRTRYRKQVFELLVEIAENSRSSFQFSRYSSCLLQIKPVPLSPVHTESDELSRRIECTESVSICKYQLFVGFRLHDNAVGVKRLDPPHPLACGFG